MHYFIFEMSKTVIILRYRLEMIDCRILLQRAILKTSQ